jgi:hypothetical protein
MVGASLIKLRWIGQFAEASDATIPSNGPLVQDGRNNFQKSELVRLRKHGPHGFAAEPSKPLGEGCA